ncbi:unnamed protein product, partial [Dibothriocephalus latus]
MPSQLTCTSRAERRYVLRTLLGLIEVNLLCRPLAHLDATDPDQHTFLPTELLTLKASLRYCQDPHALPAVSQIAAFLEKRLQSTGLQRLLVGKTLEDVQDPYVTLACSVRAVWLQGHDVSVSFDYDDPHHTAAVSLPRSDETSFSSKDESILPGRVFWRSSASFYEAALRLADLL